jgi:hypothetical protein
MTDVAVSLITVDFTQIYKKRTKMAILRPIAECHIEISLSQDVGEMNYRASFITASELKAHKIGTTVSYDPITIGSCFDPIYYKDLINYCVEHLGTKKGSEDSFTLVFGITCPDGLEVTSQYRLTGCELIGYSLPKFSRDKGELAQFSLTFQPSRVSKLLT